MAKIGVLLMDVALVVRWRWEIDESRRGTEFIDRRERQRSVLAGAAAVVREESRVDPK